LLKECYAQRDRDDLLEVFLKDNSDDLISIFEYKVLLADFKDIHTTDLAVLKVAFQLIPVKTSDNNLKKIAKSIINAFAKKLQVNAEIDYSVKLSFLATYAVFLLNRDSSEINEYTKPFSDCFDDCDVIPDLFKRLILAEDKLKTYNCFWTIWGLFKNHIVRIAQDKPKSNKTKKIIIAYLLAQDISIDNTKEWHALKRSDARHFKNMASEIGHCSFVLYALSKLIYGIGSHYLDSGIFWISKMINDNDHLNSKNIEPDTIFYIERITKKYIYLNSQKIKKTNSIKIHILIILDFLVNKESATGYMLRESVI
jgi:hypothetical protein